jgi:hypothetical protein
MVDNVAVFSDADAAALYDLLNPWDPEQSPGDRFYHELVMAAGSVLDVGRGTGTSRFEIEAQYGDWNRGPVTATSREIITIARRG